MYNVGATTDFLALYSNPRLTRSVEFMPKLLTNYREHNSAFMFTTF